MFSYVHHTNTGGSLLLNILSSFIAFVLGAFSAVPLSYSKITLEIQTLFFNADNILFLIHSVIGGCIALFVKVGGDMLIHKWKNKKKGEQNE